MIRLAGRCIVSCIAGAWGIRIARFVTGIGLVLLARFHLLLTGAWAILLTRALTTLLSVIALIALVRLIALICLVRITVLVLILLSHNNFLTHRVEVNFLARGRTPLAVPFKHFCA